MFYGQKILALVIGLSSFAIAIEAQANVDSEPVDKRSDIAFRHVMFEQYQENHRAAYIAADYYRSRQIENEAMTLAKAAASLELGYLDHGRALIAELEEVSLLPENQSRLRLYLARDAYRRRDWPLLEAQLVLLAELELTNEWQKQHQTYLHMELARHQGELDLAAEHFERLEESSSLRLHGLFNLAVSYAAQPEKAVQMLNLMVEQPPVNFSELMLVDRARVALAELYIAQGDSKSARDHLAKVSASHQYGPRALAQLARIEMAEERYENAAAIWQHLEHNFPWHRASTHATSGLGYALQMSRGDEVAFGVYSGGLEKMLNQHSRLTSLSEQIQKRLNSPELFSVESESLLVWLADELGHEDWLSWFASADVRSTASRWQALDQAYRKLLDDGEQLDSLLAVDHEQQDRVRFINQAVIEGELVQQLSDVTEKLTYERQYLVAKKFKFDDDLKNFATDTQLANLDEVDYLQNRFDAIGSNLVISTQAAELQDRINRLRGVVRFELFDQVPREKQKLISALDQRLLKAEFSSARLGRIIAAADKQPTSVSARIERLAQKRKSLEQETLLAVTASQQQLLAGLNELITEDQSRLAKQMAGLQYDITRLADRRVADVQVTGAAP